MCSKQQDKKNFEENKPGKKREIVKKKSNSSSRRNIRLKMLHVLRQMLKAARQEQIQRKQARKEEGDCTYLDLCR
jgi:hypothetical protein